MRLRVCFIENFEEKNGGKLSNVWQSLGGVGMNYFSIPPKENLIWFPTTHFNKQTQIQLDESVKNSNQNQDDKTFHSLLRNPKFCIGNYLILTKEKRFTQGRIECFSCYPWRTPPVDINHLNEYNEGIVNIGISFYLSKTLNANIGDFLSISFGPFPVFFLNFIFFNFII